MPGREYVCNECTHRFRAPQGVPRCTSSLMCPACGNVDLMIVSVQRLRPVVMRAKEPARVGDLGQLRGGES